MFKHYFKIGFRSLARNKKFTTINIVGLAAGISVCLIIFLVIQYELSFDNFHKDKANIYLVLQEEESEDGIHYGAGVPFPLPKAFQNDFPTIVSSGVYAMSDNQINVMGGNPSSAVKKFKEAEGVFYVEPAFFKLFNFPLLAGEYSSLNEPNTTLLTKEIAEKYFGDWHLAIGKTVKRNDRDLLKVTGVLASIPPNTDFPIKLIISFKSLDAMLQRNSDDWKSISSNFGFYFALPKGMSPSAMQAQLKQFGAKYGNREESSDRYAIGPLSEVHYKEGIGNFSNRIISANLINAMWLIAFFILLIACINFINLATAQAFNRAKEVGIKKVFGVNKGQLHFQFYSETIIITALAIVLSILFVWIIIPVLNDTLNLPSNFNLFSNSTVVLFLLAIGIVVVFLAGFYPAFFLSKFSPIAALKSKSSDSNSKGINIRRGLVVFQFAIAQVLIVSTIMVVRQMNFMRNYELGFDKEAIVNIAFPRDSVSRSKLTYLKDKLLTMDGISQVSFSMSSPAGSDNWFSNLRYEGTAKNTDWSANLKWVDDNYLKTYGIELIAGRNINYSDTAKEFIVNETLLKLLGIKNPQDIINKKIDLWDGRMNFPVVGVVKDFNSLSLQEEMVPVLIASNKRYYEVVGIKLKGNNWESTLKMIETEWNQIFPDFVFEKKFLDAQLEAFYINENRIAKLYKIFAGLAIFLSCLGLYGLASFIANQKTKEIGIRRVLGASIYNIIYLFSKEFILLIGIAFIIAAPVAWYFMQKWLEDFTFRINMSIWIVLVSGLAAIIIALITISFQAIKAALTNPIKSIRTE
jgi:putative ABC transport system permease protein